MAGNTMGTTNDTARYLVKIGGQECTQSNPNGLESLSCEDHLDMIGVCEATFSGSQGTGWSSVHPGDPVEVSFGGSQYKVFVGVITSMRHGFQHGRDTLTIVAMDPLSKLAASRQTDTNFDDMTDSDVVTRIVGSAGGETGQVDATSETRKYHIQRNESALEICRRYAARNPTYILRANEGKIDFCKLQLNDPPVEIEVGKLISLDYQQSPRALPSSMTVQGWDYQTKQTIEGTANPSDLQSIGAGTMSPTNSPIWQGETARITDMYVESQQSAKDSAVAQFFWTALNFLKGRAVVQGNGALHAGVRVKFKQHQSGFNPDAVIISSRHRVYVGSGFTSEISFSSNTYANGGASSGAGDALASTPASTAAAGGGAGGGGAGGGGAGGGAPAGAAGFAGGGAAGGAPGGGAPGAAAPGGGAPALAGGGAPGAAAAAAVPGAAGAAGAGGYSPGAALGAAASQAGAQMESALGAAGGQLDAAGVGAGSTLENAGKSATDQVKGAEKKLEKGDVHGAIDQAKGAGKTLTGGYQGAMGQVTAGAAGAAGTVVGGASQAGQSVLKGAGEEVKGAAGAAIGEAGLPDKVSGKATDAVNKAVDKGVQKGDDEIKKGEEKAKSEITEAQGKVDAAVGEAVGEVDAKIDEGAQKAHDAVDKAVAEVKEALGPLGDKLPDLPGSGGGDPK